MKNRKNKIVAWYSILLGTGVFILWTFLLFNEPVQEGKKEMFFHLFSEAIMAALCIAGGFVLLKKNKPLILIAAHAMVIYSVLNAAGYYFEKHENSMVILFIVLFVISGLILPFALKNCVSKT
jgi:hypothetical protein